MSKASIPAPIRSAIAIGNVNSVGLTSSILSNVALSNVIANVNLAQQAAVSSQQSMGQIQLAVVGTVTKRMTSLNLAEAMAAAQLASVKEQKLLEVLRELLKKKA